MRNAGRRERELEEHATRVEEQRRGLPWVPVQKEYTFATETGPKSLSELFEGRSRLLIYHLMFGEDWNVACPGCSSLVDGVGGVLMHLNDRDVTLLCMSQAPLEKLVAYKRRRGWTVPYVSGHGDGFLFDYGYAFRREDMSGIVREEFDMARCSARRRSGYATTARTSGRPISRRPCPSARAGACSRCTTARSTTPTAPIRIRA
jgi:predicted dithiol-disulfide oxidoreductase (DUF899 family)